MVLRVEAQSLDFVTRLADDPPLQIRRYPPPPPPHDPAPQTSLSNQLKLYIVRVPNSQDVILTTLKPQSSVVTAQDILSCLYYLRIQPIDHTQRPRSQSLQPTGGLTPENDRPGSYARSSFSGEAPSSHLRPRSNPQSSFLSPSTDSLGSSFHSTGSGGSGFLGRHQENDFEITFIRRDKGSGSQQTVGRIFSNMNALTPLDPLVPTISNSFAAAMMAQEANHSKKGKRDRKRLSLEIWTKGYEKFLTRRKTVQSPSSATTNRQSGVPDTDNPSPRSVRRDSMDSYDQRQEGMKALLWPAPVPPPAPGMEDVGPPPPPKPEGMVVPKPSPAVSRISRFTEIYSPDTPVIAHGHQPNQQHNNLYGQQLQPATLPEATMVTAGEFDEDECFTRTLNLEGEGFWKNTGKRLSAFGAHRRAKSQPDISQPFPMDEETRAAMEKMGLHSPYAAPPSPQYNADGGPGLSGDQGRDSKGKRYVFEPPLRGTGKCEFETNSVGRKIRLKLYPTGIANQYAQYQLVKLDPILLCTMSFQPPDQTGGGGGLGRRSPSPSGKEHKSRFKFSEKFKKLGRQGSWTEHVEQEAGSGLKSKLGSLLIEGEGMDVLDFVVVSSMGVFWRRYLDWKAELRDGGW